jgi:outer membrane protein OmpA-like peptidoglycan-associated protein
VFKFLRLFFILQVVFLEAEAAEATYKTPLERSKWLFNGDVYSCVISHKITAFGDVRLIALPGRKPSINIYANEFLLTDKLLEASVISHYWEPSNALQISRFAGMGKQAETDINVDLFVRALEQGRAWQIKVFDGQGVLEYKLVSSPVSTQGLANEFNGCVAGLLPQPFEYVRNINLWFAPGTDYIASKPLQDIRAVAAYVKADKSIREILVDGHSDSGGDHLENLMLSKKRADRVVARLIEFGVSPKQIQIRHHGERYPQAKNASELGRQANRRVSIRLVKDESS